MSATARSFQQFVLKVHSRCDLACDHCYVYRHADQSWRRRPRIMTPSTVRTAAARIAEHAAVHQLKQVSVVLHGGEPLLMGRERLQWVARQLRGAIEGVTVLDLRMQTNGLLLDAELCAMLAQERILTGVSLDGDRASHDRHRVRADGSGSYDAAVRAVRLLNEPAHRPVFAGLLCTVDVANDPDAVYGALAGLRPPRIDFLLPHATWDHPPFRPHGTGDFADWLIAVYERWNAEGRPFSIRLFESVEAAAAGDSTFSEALGLASPDLAVVETDGAIEQADWLKTVAQGAPETGFHVLTSSFDEAAAHPGFQADRLGLEGLCEQCRSCPVVQVCGGGLYGHRHRAGSGFDNPSVYCADLFALIRHVQNANTPSRHGLAEADFHALAAGDGAAVQDLGAAQLSLRRSMLAYLHRAGIGSPAAWQAMFALDGPALDTVLEDPAVHTWAVNACAAHAGGLVPPEAGGVDGIALATALRAQRVLELTIGPVAGSILLPTLGRLLLPPSDRGRPVRLITDGGRVRRIDGVSVQWQPIPRLEVDALRVQFAYGDFYPGRPPQPGRPTTGEAARFGGDAQQHPQPDTATWQAHFVAAWSVLARAHVHRADGLAAGLRTVIPLGADLPEDAPRPPFGAVALPLGESPEALAISLIREFQYAKFAALCDMYDLPGPGEAALRHAYVRLAVADASCRAPGPDAGSARAHTSLLDALDVLAGSERVLSGPGRHLAAGIRLAARTLPWPARDHV